jgi:hypothetical protein
MASMNEYFQAKAGEMPEPSAGRLLEARRLCVNFDNLYPYAVKRVWEAVKWRRTSPAPKGWRSAWKFLEDELVLRKPEGWRHWKQKDRDEYRRKVVQKVVCIVLDKARTSTRYWGVDTPETHGYCSYCKSARLHSEFTKSDHTCDVCFDRRKGRP